MTSSGPYSNEDLTAFLDGELDHATMEQIEAALKTDEDLQNRLSGLQIPTQDIAQAFNKLAASGPAMPPLPSRKRPALLRPALLAGSLAASLAIGVFLGSGTDQPPAPKGWMSYVSAYQALYTTETLAMMAPSEAEKDQQVAALGDILGRDLSPALRAQNLDFRRGQLLGFKGKPLIQMAFLASTGAPVALCVIRSDGAPDAAIQLTTLEGMSAAHWSDGGYKFLLIGGDDAALITNAAQAFSEVL